MPEATKSSASTLTTVTAIVGLCGSLLGNYIQYKSIDDNKTKLAQAQEKLDADYRAVSQRDTALQSQKINLQLRMQQVDNKIQEVTENNQASQTAMAHVHTAADLAEAQQDFKNSQAEYIPLVAEKKAIQDKLDALQTTIAACPPAR